MITNFLLKKKKLPVCVELLSVEELLIEALSLKAVAIYFCDIQSTDENKSKHFSKLYIMHVVSVDLLSYFWKCTEEREWKITGRGEFQNKVQVNNAFVVVFLYRF